MRVIAGTCRRRTLLSPRGDRVTRPIPDRVKQSLFDRLAANRWLGVEACLDIFAGTGSLGIEALSRGVGRCTFIERDRSARKLLEQNLANLGLADRASVMGVDALSAGWVGLLASGSVGLVFCDPPYRLTSDPDSMARVVGLIAALGPKATADGLLVLRTDRHAQPQPAQGWDGPESQRYGSMAVHGYTHRV